VRHCNRCPFSTDNALSTCASFLSLLSHALCCTASTRVAVVAAVPCMVVPAAGLSVLLVYLCPVQTRAARTAIVVPPSEQLPYQTAHRPVYSRSSPPQLAPWHVSNQHLGGKPPCSTGTQHTTSQQPCFASLGTAMFTGHGIKCNTLPRTGHNHSWADYDCSRLPAGSAHISFHHTIPMRGRNCSFWYPPCPTGAKDDPREGLAQAQLLHTPLAHQTGT
jgi:hypothetical protein